MTDIVIQIPTVIKSYNQDGKRLFTVEASNENIDLEGDIILQDALRRSADFFLKKGVIDFNHFSELLPNERLKWVIGRPRDVTFTNEDSRTTIVKGEIFRGDQFDPWSNLADKIWASIINGEPWYASIYGKVLECEKESGAAPRMLVKSMVWTSLALTQSPANHTLKSLRIIKSREWERFILAKTFGLDTETVFKLNDLTSGSDISDMRTERLNGYWNMPRAFNSATKCMKCSLGAMKADLLTPWVEHFIHCEGCAPEEAELLARACLHKALDGHMNGVGLSMDAEPNPMQLGYESRVANSPLR